MQKSCPRLLYRLSSSHQRTPAILRALALNCALSSSEAPRMYLRTSPSTKPERSLELMLLSNYQSCDSVTPLAAEGEHKVSS